MSDHILGGHPTENMVIKADFRMHFSAFQTSNMAMFLSTDTEIPKNFYPNESYLIRALLYRKKRNMNSFVLVVGDPRSSKSYFCLKIASRLGYLQKKPFDVEKQLTFDDISKFLNWSLINTEDSFILDETGTSLSPEQFWELEQRVMRRFVQTQGFRKNILFWSLPSIVFIQKRFRFLTNYAIKTLHQGKVNVYKIVVDQLIGKGYPSYRETISFDMPDKEIIDKYEKMKKEWNDNLVKADIEWMKPKPIEDEKKLPENEFYKY